MQIIVTRENFESVLRAISLHERASVDTETTGLYPFHGDKLFSVVMSTKQDDFYFDFNIGGALPRSWIIHLQVLFDNVKYWKFINFKYDMAMLFNEGIRFPRSMRILDGGVCARVHYNLHRPQKGTDEGNFSLDYLALFYLGLRKSDEVLKYCEEHNLYKIDVMGDKAPDFQRVPTPIMAKYAMSDSRLTYDIVDTILRKINEADQIYADERLPGTPSLMTVLARESMLSYELFKAYYEGFQADREYIQRAIVRENEIVEDLEKKIKAQTPPGFNYSSSAQLGKFLIDKGVKLPMTKPNKKTKDPSKFKPKPKTDKDTLELYLQGVDIPVVQMILKAKQAQKKVSTYYENYLWMMDANGIIHGGFNQETTVTGRFSSSNPNLQNLGKTKVWEEWAVRNAFKAFEDHYLACIDYAQQEMRVVADRARELPVIDKILGGLDFYDANSEVMLEIMRVVFDRQTSKKVALGVVYGQGKDLLAHNLKVSAENAAQFKKQYLNAMPAIKNMNDKLIKRAERYGRIFTAYGRCIHIDKGYEYKALNAYVQGTSADMTKESLVRIGAFFHEMKAKSKITGTVHDENLFNIYKTELELLPGIQKCMVESYPHISLPMAAEVDLSRTSWAAKKAQEEFEDYYL